MDVVFWFLAGGMTGWLTGKLIGQKGYGKSLLAGYARSLDIFVGVVGASIGAYVFFWAVTEKGSSFNYYATAILGSVALVGACRLISARYFPPRSYRGMSRAAFIEWQDSLP